MLNSELSFLVVGFDSAYLASSAKKAGYKVYAVDYFGDLDLRKSCDEYESIIQQEPLKSCGKIELNFNPEAFLNLAKVLVKRNKIDALLLSSGLDDSFDILRQLDNLVPILGNSPNVIEAMRNKLEFFEELKHLGIFCPKTHVAKNLKEAEKCAEEIGYPMIVKPFSSFAGVGVRKIKNAWELKKAFHLTSLSCHCKKALLQEYIQGIHASVSFISNSKQVKVLSLNEQLLGLSQVNQHEHFGYCGNISPLNNVEDVARICEEIVQKLVQKFKLKGSNGIDIVISENHVPYVIEVNPRFQATLRCLEELFGFNLVKAHVEACMKKRLPRIENPSSSFCTRLILYAPHKVVTPNLTNLKGIGDIPVPWTIIEKGEPVCSVFAHGETRNESFENAMKLANFVFKKLRKV